MKKENILFGIIGMLVGLIIGFLATNQLNRSQVNQIQPTVTATNSSTNSQKAAVPAVAEAIDAADKNPQDFVAQVKAGDMFARIKNFPKAIEYYERANNIRPDDYETLVLLGNANYDSEKWEVSSTWYEKALAKKPESVDVRTDLGVTYIFRQTPDYERAIKEFLTSLKTNPTHEPTLYNLAFAYSKIGDEVAMADVKSRIKSPELLKKLETSR
jgi:tetratricopeptide (TPR) repeat protein